jgi:hypothetical protein
MNTVMESADGLMAALFYIELIGRPVLKEAGYACRAQIRCRLLPSKPALKALVDRLARTHAHFYFSYHKIPCISRQLHAEVMSDGEAFSRRFEFSVSSLQDSIDVKIDGVTKRGRSISNCPYTVDTIMRDQGLHCVFGHKDHQERYLGTDAKFN